jgi:hypothetical protein
MSLLQRLFGSVRGRHPAPKRALYDIFLSNRRQDLAKWHHYFDIYERHLAPYRGRAVTVLEIGLWRGGSLRMWREYFGTAARICGIDVDPATAAYERDGYDIFVGDQADRTFLRQVKDELGAIDIVIDDGGHKMSQQVNAFEELYPETRHVYIVEDTHTSYWPEYQDRPTGTFIDYAKDKVDALHEWHRQPPEDRRLYAVPPAERLRPVEVSQFCAQTRSVHFYDSIVVFEKGENPPRWRETR